MPAETSVCDPRERAVTEIVARGLALEYMRPVCVAGGMIVSNAGPSRVFVSVLRHKREGRWWPCGGCVRAFCGVYWVLGWAVWGWWRMNE